jgi:hypothetical protein
MNFTPGPRLPASVRRRTPLADALLVPVGAEAAAAGREALVLLLVVVAVHLEGANVVITIFGALKKAIFCDHFFFHT